LGNVVVKKFKDAAWKTLCVDVRASDIADHSVIINGDGTKEDTQQIITKVQDLHLSLDSVVSVAGGFMMGNIKNDGIFAQTEKMLAFNLKSAISAAHVASHCLKEEGLLVLTGASSALHETPAFIGYGISKAATHHLISSIAQKDSGMPKGSYVVGMLPVMLDTPQNRKDIPSGNFANWTPLEDVADILLNWSNGKDRPANGSLVEIETKNSKTSCTPVKK